MYNFSVIQAISDIFIVKYIYNPLLIDVLVAYGIVVTQLVNGRLPCCHQSKCIYCIHALLGCSHFPSCAFKSKCENSTLALLQRFVELVLLELSELSSHAFSQSGNNFSRAELVMMLLTSVSEK